MECSPEMFKADRRPARLSVCGKRIGDDVRAAAMQRGLQGLSESPSW
jgi:hypothetical protein